MGQAWQVVRATFLKIIHNFGPLLAIFVPNVIAAAAIILVFVLIEPREPNWLNLCFRAVRYVIMLYIYAAMAVNLHRYFLLDEEPKGYLPFQFHWKISLRYLISILVLFAVTILPIWFLTDYLLRFQIGLRWFMGDRLSGWLILFGQYLLLWPSLWLFLRLSPILPSMAIGKPMSWKEAWRSTRAHNGMFIGLGFFLLLMSFAFQFIGEFMTPFWHVRSFLLFWVLVTLYISLAIIYILMQLGIITQSYVNTLTNKTS